jgi:hypothetical protein
MLLYSSTIVFSVFFYRNKFFAVLCLCHNAINDLILKCLLRIGKQSLCLKGFHSVNIIKFPSPHPFPRRVIGIRFIHKIEEGRIEVVR